MVYIDFELRLKEGDYQMMGLISEESFEINLEKI